MKIALIKCPWWVRYSPPYILAYFATLLRQKDHSVKVYDLNNILYHRVPDRYKEFWDNRDYYSIWENPSYIEQVFTLAGVDSTLEDIIKSSPQVVCFTTHTPNTIFSEKLASMIKEKDKSIVTVFMGHKCSPAQMASDFVSNPDIDYVCTGEADISICELVEKLDNRTRKELPRCRGFLTEKTEKIKGVKFPPLVKNLDELPFPDYRDFSKDIKERSYSQPERLDILDSRGCVSGCHFCYERLYWGPFRTMSGKKIFEEIKYHIKNFPQINYFYFNGLLLNGSLEVLNDLCDYLINSSISVTWAGQAIIRKGMDEILLNKMAKAGCRWLGYGVESGSDKVLAQMNKKHTVKDSLRVLKDTKKAGISVQANMMFGYPTETEEDFQETLDFIKKARPYIDNVLASQSFCTLEKKTKLREKPERFGINENTHHLYWKSQGGANNYAERFRRYEEFCSLALRLGIPETSGVLLKKPDKWMLLGDYYKYEKNYRRAVECYEKALSEEEPTRELFIKLERCYTFLGNSPKARTYREKAIKEKEKLSFLRKEE